MFDNPYDQDPNQAMVMVVSDTCRIPFVSEGSTIYFTSSYPTNEDMESYPHIVITSDTSGGDYIWIACTPDNFHD